MRGLQGWSEARVERSHLRPGPTGFPAGLPRHLVREVIPEPGGTPRPAFPQSIFLCSYFVATTERFYAEGPTDDPTEATSLWVGVARSRALSRCAEPLRVISTSEQHRRCLTTTRPWSPASE
jgi:hypothetical protein